MTYPPFCTTCRNKFEKIWFHQGVWSIRSEVKNEKHELSETINLKKCNILHKNWKFGFCFQLAKKKKKKQNFKQTDFWAKRNWSPEGAEAFQWKTASSHLSEETKYNKNHKATVSTVYC